MCFNFLLVYPADGVLMCVDIGKISDDDDSAKMGICIDKENQDKLAGLFAVGMGSAGSPGGGGGGGNLGSLEAFSDMTILFEAGPKNVSSYVDPICLARTPAFDAAAHRQRGRPSTWLVLTSLTAALASRPWLSPA